MGALRLHCSKRQLHSLAWELWKVTRVQARKGVFVMRSPRSARILDCKSLSLVWMVARWFTHAQPRTVAERPAVGFCLPPRRYELGTGSVVLSHVQPRWVLASSEILLSLWPALTGHRPLCPFSLVRREGREGFFAFLGRRSAGRPTTRAPPKGALPLLGMLLPTICCLRARSTQANFDLGQVRLRPGPKLGG